MHGKVLTIVILGSLLVSTQIFAQDDVISKHKALMSQNSKDAKAIETKHSTAGQAALIAKKANADKLLIGHFSARYRELKPLLDEASAVFPNTSLALEGETFVIEE